MTHTLHPAIGRDGSNYTVTTYEFDWDTLVNFKDGLVFETPFTVDYGCPSWCITTESREVAEFVADTFDTPFD